jgi:predicted small secreted protein
MKTATLILILTAVLVTGCAGPGVRGWGVDTGHTYIRKNPDTTPEVQAMILDGQIQLLMTKPEVQASWGAPDRTIEGVGRDVWVYNRGGSAVIGDYLYFSSGTLVDVERVR